MVLKIRKKDLDKILLHARKCYPLEACGILVGVIQGRIRLVWRVFKTRNVLGSSSAYQIDAEEQFQIFLQAERDAMEVLGFYHSHPFWQAKPSGVDVSSAHYPGCSYLIYSVPDDELRSYIWKGDRFVSESVRIV